MTDVQRILNKACDGLRLTEEEAIALYNSDCIHEIAMAADRIKRSKTGEYVYFVVNRHINPTNICLNRCRFCAFSRSPGQQGAYELTIDEILQKIANAKEPLKEVHIVGGLHPEWSFEHYCQMLREIKKNFPGLTIKAFTAVEIDHFCRISGLGLREVLEKLKEAGLDMIPGGGAEILDTEIRKKLCPEKIPAHRWIQIHKEAHRLGIKSNATMLYGHIESYRDRVKHMSLLRNLQDETGGFLAFIPLSYNPAPGTKAVVSGIDDLKTIAISRLFLDNIAHIKAYWIMLGEKLSQVALLFGADDLEGTVLEERITHATGTQTPEGLTRDYLIHLITSARRIPVERDSFYNHLKIYDAETDKTTGTKTVP